MAKNKKTRNYKPFASRFVRYIKHYKPACSQLQILNPVSNFRRHSKLFQIACYRWETHEPLLFGRGLTMKSSSWMCWKMYIYLSIYLSIDLSIHPSIHTYIYIIIIVIVLIIVTVVFPFIIFYGILLSVVLSRIIHDKSITFSASHVILKINDSHLSIINIKC